MKFLQHRVSDVYKLGNLHLCHTLGNQTQKLGECVSLKAAIAVPAGDCGHSGATCLGCH